MILAFFLASAATADPLTLALAAAHRDYSAQLVDKFAETSADASVIGTPFKFVGAVKDGEERGGTPGGAYFTYVAGKLRFIFIPREKSADSAYRGPRYMVGVIGGSRKPRRSYVGTNAFGASANVRVESYDANGLAMFERPAGETNPYRSTDVSPAAAAYLPQDSAYWLELAVSGAEARKVAHDTNMEVEGTLAAFPDGKLSLCQPFYVSATLDNPLQLYGAECWVGAKVRRIAFVRRSTGEVLKEWLAP